MQYNSSLLACSAACLEIVLTMRFHRVAYFTFESIAADPHQEPWQSYLGSGTYPPCHKNAASIVQGDFSFQAHGDRPWARKTEFTGSEEKESCEHNVTCNGRCINLGNVVEFMVTSVFEIVCS